jgi:hypothetical protein
MSFASIRRSDLDVESKHEIQNAEAGYLRKMLVMEKQKKTSESNDLINSEQRLIQVARFHTCNQSCGPFKSLKPSQKFMYQSKQWTATGFVFICPSYGKIHVCGIDDCLFSKTSMNCSNIVCSLTGMDLGVGITLARTRKDQDLYAVGNELVTSYVWSRKSEGVTESQGIKKIENTVDAIQEAYESNAHRFLSHLSELDALHTLETDPSSLTQQVEEEDGKNGKKRKTQESNPKASSTTHVSLAELEEQEPDFLQGVVPENDTTSYFVPEDECDEEKESKTRRKRSQAKKTIDKTIPTASSQRFSLTPVSMLETTSTLYQELLQISGGRESDVLDITTRFPFSSMESIKQKLISRCNLRKSANIVWDVYVVTQAHLDIIEERVRKATKIWRKFVISYYQKCKEERRLPDKLHITNIYRLDVLVHYEGVFYGGDVPLINKSMRNYIIDSMVKLWEKFEEMPGVLTKQITFESCCAALLNSMRGGLKIEVYLLGNDPKPMIWGNLSIAQQRKAIARTITFIEPHPNLILKETDHVRKDIIEDKKKRAGNPTRPIGGKTIYASRQRGSSGGKTNNLSQIIPSLKNLYTVLDAVVGGAPTIQVLESYCLVKIQGSFFSSSYKS